jgi:hypothetical protein
MSTLHMADMTTVLSDEGRDANWRSPGAQIGHNNREAVRQFFADHLGCTNVECSRKLGLSVDAVGRHVASIRKEWSRP